MLLRRSIQRSANNNIYTEVCYWKGLYSGLLLTRSIQRSVTEKVSSANIKSCQLCSDCNSCRCAIHCRHKRTVLDAYCNHWLPLFAALSLETDTCPSSWTQCRSDLLGMSIPIADYTSSSRQEIPTLGGYNGAWGDDLYRAIHGIASLHRIRSMSETLNMHIAWRWSMRLWHSEYAREHLPAWMSPLIIRTVNNLVILSTCWNTVSFIATDNVHWRDLTMRYYGIRCSSLMSIACVRACMHKMVCINVVCTLERSTHVAP